MLTRSIRMILFYYNPTRHLGVKSVTLYDPKPTTYVDLSANFFLSEVDVGKSRAEISAPKLAELNAYVPVNVLTGNLGT